MHLIFELKKGNKKKESHKYLDKENFALISSRITFPSQDRKGITQRMWSFELCMF